MRSLTGNTLTSLVAFMLATAMSAVHAESAPQTIANAMPGTEITGTSPTVIDGLYEVIAGQNVLYVDTTGRYLVIGSIYDLKEDVDLSAERRAELSKATVTTGAVRRTMSIRELPMSAAITTGEGERSLTVITDPQCAWCRRLWIESLANLEGVAVNHLLLNHSGQALGILCAPDPAKALGEAFKLAATTTKTPVPSAACRRQASEKIARVVGFAERVGMLGTPILIREDGEVHAGYLGRSELLTWLGGNRDDT